MNIEDMQMLNMLRELEIKEIDISATNVIKFKFKNGEHLNIWAECNYGKVPHFEYDVLDHDNDS